MYTSIHLCISMHPRHEGTTRSLMATKASTKGTTICITSSISI